MTAPRRWPLAVVLDLAAREEATAAAALADALARAEAAARERDLALGALREHRAAEERSARRLPGAPSPAPLRGAEEVRGRAGLLCCWALHLARLRDEGARLDLALARREAALAAARAEATRRQAARASASARVRALEEARDVWRASRRRERDRAEEDEAEETWAAVSARRAAAS